MGFCRRSSSAPIAINEFIFLSCRPSLARLSTDTPSCQIESSAVSLDFSYLFIYSCTNATQPTTTCRCQKVCPPLPAPRRVADDRPATVQKIITEILPPSSGQTFSKDARDLLMECCVEFITLISSEANEISEKEAKKTIACEHVERALRDLGFGDYIPDVLAVAEEHKEQLKVRASSVTRVVEPGVSILTHGSRERRSRARWNRVDCRKRNSFDSNRSCSGRRRRSIMRHQSDDDVYSVWMRSCWTWSLRAALGCLF